MDTITFLIIVAVILCIISLIHGYRTGEFRDKTLKEYLYKNILIGEFHIDNEIIEVKDRTGYFIGSMY